MPKKLASKPSVRPPDGILPKIFYFVVGCVTVGIIWYGVVERQKVVAEESEVIIIDRETYDREANESHQLQEKAASEKSEKERLIRVEKMNERKAQRAEIYDLSKATRYTSKKLGISILVPKYGKATETEQGLHITVRTEQGDPFQQIIYVPTAFSIRENSERLTPMNWFEKTFASSKDKESFFIQEFQVGQSKGIKIRSSESMPLQFYLFHNDKILSVSLIDSGDPLNVIYQDDIRSNMVNSIIWQN